MRRARLALGLLALAACAKPLPKVDDDPSAVEILTDGAVVKSGTIGTGDPNRGRYVLVDARNKSAADRLVTLTGDLGPSARIGPDELRIPAGGVRTFALVADGTATDAARPAIKVANAVAVTYPPQIVISEEQTRRGDLTVVTGRAKNIVETTASVVMTCTFYDEGGKILTRPFTVIELAPDASQLLRFEGPKESARAVLFVGQVAFKP